MSIYTLQWFCNTKFRVNHGQLLYGIHSTSNMSKRREVRASSVDACLRSHMLDFMLLSAILCTHVRDFTTKTVPFQCKMLTRLMKNM